MHRSSSIGNKTTYQKTINKNYVLHLERLQKIKSTSSQTLQLQNKNSQLMKNSSLLRQNNRKKELETELSHIKIDRENKILLDKMTKIVNRSSIENPIKIAKSESRARSLNENVRKSELEKIMMQNQGIINRLRQQTSFYNVKNWEKDYKMRETYLKNMGENTLHEGLINAQTERLMRRTVAISTIESPNKRGSVERRSKLSFSIKPSLSNLPAGGSGPHSRTESTSRRLVVHKKESQINGIDYLVEFSFVEGNFQIAMHRKDDLETKYITYEEQKGRVLLLEHNNRYDKIISKIDFKDGEPFIKGFGFDSVLHESTKIELFNSFPKEEEQQKIDKVEKNEDKKGDKPVEGKDEVKSSTPEAQT